MQPDTKQPPKLFTREIPVSSRYIITAAQNATPVHEAFLRSLETAARHLGAELVVIPLRYKNPTRLGENADGDWWAEAVVPYLFDGRAALHKHLILVADVKSQPTAVSPLSGFEAMTGAESCIIGHPKMQFRPVPVPGGRFPKILTTTGACTERNYSDTRAGKLGEFHHFLGALMVEIDGPRFHIRQLNADRTDGSFIDLDLHYTPAGVRKAPRALGLVCGDLHEWVTCPDVERATWGAGGMVEVLDPEVVVEHDGADGMTTNPHDVGNPFVLAAKVKAGRTRVEDELRSLVAYLNARATPRRKVVLVDSNHHDFLARWLIRTDWRNDPGNALFYLETAAETLRSAQMTGRGPEYMDPFPVALRKLGLSEHVRCLGPDESFLLADIECGLHGHRGPNGSRGSLKNLSRVGGKVIIGHSHSPGINEGGYQVGTSTPRRLSYAHGPSSWLQTHCVVYANGKRALISVIDGAWRLAMPITKDSP